MVILVGDALEVASLGVVALGSAARRERFWFCLTKTRLRPRTIARVIMPRNAEKTARSFIKIIVGREERRCQE